MSRYDAALIRYSQGRAANLGKVENKSLPWRLFKDQNFGRPVRTKEPLREYLRYSEDEQKRLKSSAGYWYRTHVQGAVRNRGSGLPSDLVTFDFDYATPEFFASLPARLHGLECFIHTSRRHTPEKPRFRLVVLLASPVPNDLYVPVSRILAKRIDPTMRHVDKVSFRPAQMMFLPTASSDGAYVFQEFDGTPLDWNTMLAEFEVLEGDWRDLANLPKADGESTLRQTQDKAENPTEKTGPVGDFCRAYDVPAAIAKFLPGLYIPVDMPSGKPRYTYAKGSTVNGAEVQDDGLFLYSHHGSDPTSDMLVNAFDLVRIHLFGDKDDGWDAEGKKVTDRPSWGAMLGFIADDPGYKKARFASNYDVGAMFDDLWDQEKVEVRDATADEAVWSLVGEYRAPSHEAKVVLTPTGEASLNRERPRRAAPPSTWTTEIELDNFGKVKSTAANITRILAHDLRFRDAIAFNEFENRPVLIRSLRSKHDWLASYIVANPLVGEAWQDHHDNLIRITLEDASGPGKHGWGVKVSDRDLRVAIVNTARMNTFNPVRDALTNFTWDGIERVERLFIDYLGTPDTPYHREAAKLWMIAAVTRVFEPGHKFDYAPVLIGGQGIGKSTFVATLAMEWYGELKADFSDDKKLAEQMIGVWISELPELTNMVRSDIEPMKAFMSATESVVRMSYDRQPTIFKRQTVFIGTTNKPQFLKDDTGNRRFWPILVLAERIDLGRLRRELPFLWAEAVKLYREMRTQFPVGTLPLTLSTAAVEEAIEKQEDANLEGETEIVAGKLKGWIDRLIPVGDEFEESRTAHRTEVTMPEIVAAFPDLRVSAIILGAALRHLGWDLIGRQRRGTKNPVRVYVPGRKQLQRWAEEDLI